MRILQLVEDALREKDNIRLSEEGIKAFWGIDSVNAFTRMVRAHSDIVLANGQETVDFCTMYTSFPFKAMIERTIYAIDEAWDFVLQRDAAMAEGEASLELTLGSKGWSKVGKGYSRAQVAELLTYLIEHNYVNIGGRVLRQIKGMPMGMPAAPQIANLACYPVEKAQAYALGPGRPFVVCRYIDDIYSAGVPLPSQEDYGMEYKTTAKGSSVVYLGVRVYEKEREDGTKVLHTTVHDREGSYPHHIVRYPDHATVAPREQLGGVIMGRLVHCQETCSHMEDFKDSVATVFRNAIWRGYPKQMVEKVWRRFLFLRWHAVDIRVKELRIWFPKVWAFLLKTEGTSPPEPCAPAPSLQAKGRSRFLDVFGVHPSALSQPRPSAPGARVGSSSSDSSPAPPPSAQPQPQLQAGPRTSTSQQAVSKHIAGQRPPTTMEVDRPRLQGKRALEEEESPEAAPMTVDSADLVPFVPHPAPAAQPQPEYSVVDEIMQDRVRLEASETLCRRTLAQADESGAVFAEQLVARREVTVSTPQEQFSASEEREVRAVQAVINNSSGSSSSSETPQPFVQLAGVQAVRRTLRLDQVSGAVQWEEEELARLQLSACVEVRPDEEDLEPISQDPVGETLLQLGEVPSSRVPGDDPQWNGRRRPLLPLPPPPTDGSSHVQTPLTQEDPSEMDSVVPGEDPNPSEELALSQARSATSRRSGSTSRRTYLPKALWGPRLTEQHEAFKAAASEERRREIWLGWTAQERRWVLLASGPRSRVQQLKWKAEIEKAQHAWRRRRGADLSEDDDAHD